MLHSTIIGLAHGIQLKQRIEVHKLDTRDIINLTLRNNMAQVFFHRPKGVRVAIGHGIAQDGIVVAYEHKVDAPRINTDRRDIDASFAHNLQTLNHLQIEGIDVPIEVATRLYQVIGKAGQFLLFQFAIHQCAQNGSSTSSTQVDSKIVFLILHIYISV